MIFNYRGIARICSPVSLFLLFLLPFSKIQAQGNRVALSGTVKDTGLHALVGASVQLKGSTRGILTNDVGYFSFESPAQSGTLVVSYSGYVTKEIP
ncbi:MAG: carboxypeptidase-like regulatory domain-containing protein, partial [Chitinophagaceae bacterium]|nr:carboxypeptidase-like regulatory domain-containing protein [Chitinophagaceae bacterium]